MLFKLAQLRGIAAGTIDLQFRRWDRPRARAGAKQVTAVGVIRIDDVRVVRRVTKAEARRAGFATPDAVVRALRPDGDLYRIELHLEGPDPRVALRERIPAGDDLAALRRAVERLPWGRDYLRAIAARPGVRAEELAASFGAREARVQAARAAAEGARADDLAEPGLPAVAARRGVPRAERRRARRCGPFVKPCSPSGRRNSDGDLRAT